MKAWIMLMLALSLPMAAMAEETKEGAAPKASYISLTPPFVGNYGLDGSPKLKVFKADVALRVTGDEAAQAVKANEPLIRNQLVARDIRFHALNEIIHVPMLMTTRWDARRSRGIATSVNLCLTPVAVFESSGERNELGRAVSKR